MQQIASTLEIGVRFGPTGDLVGVVAPARGPGRHRIGCLLFNAGVVSRVGPHRINVKMARELSAHGIPSLRMDLSGLGDSPPARTGLTAQAQATADLGAGLTQLTATTGVDSFVVVGICSGAEQAYALALDDCRVSGVLMFDGFTFPTVLTRPICRFRRLMRIRVGSLPQRLHSAVRPPTAGAASVLSADQFGSGPSRAEFQAAIERLLGRGARVFLMYSGSKLERHSYTQQLHHAFGGAPFLRQIDYAYEPSFDHTLTTLQSQREFVRRTVEWVSRVSASQMSRAATP